MGTRGAIRFYRNRTEKVAYNHFDEDSMMCAARFDCFLEAYIDSDSCEEFEELETSNKDK